jgi:hypothetical protein
MYGYDPVIAAAPMVPSTSNKFVQELLMDRRLHTELLKQHFAAAQNRIKAQADKQRTYREFQVGDSVLLKLQLYAQSSVVNRPCPKLAYKFFGLYKVLERIGKAAYKLELPSDSLIRPVFHISQLKQSVPDFTPVFDKLPVEANFSTESCNLRRF